MVESWLKKYARQKIAIFLQIQQAVDARNFNFVPHFFTKNKDSSALSFAFLDEIFSDS